MGCWDIFCCICGNSYRQLDNYDYEEFNKLTSNKEYNELIKKSKWLLNCTMLLQNNKVIHGCKEIGCNIEFQGKNGIQYTAVDYDNIIPYIGNNSNIGIFIHTNCWKYVKIKYKVELKYSDIPLTLINKRFKPSIKYGDITKYQSQDMQYYKMFQDNNIYMISDPLKNDKMNSIRLKKIISQFKLKTIKRPSPSMSATFHKTNDIRLGNNEKFWIIKNNKWFEIKEPIVLKTIIIDYKKTKMNIIKEINSIPQIGEKNTKLLFVNNFISNNKTTKIQLIGCEININKIVNKLLI